jgi:hypothetical protein
LLLLGPRETFRSHSSGDSRLNWASDMYSKLCANTTVSKSCFVSVDCQFFAIVASAVQIEQMVVLHYSVRRRKHGDRQTGTNLFELIN